MLELNASINFNSALPWHASQWEMLWGAYKKRYLPHALLLQGTSGLEEFIFAKRFAQALQCLQASRGQEGCGRCHSCHLFKAGTHPDFLLITPEKNSTGIKIDQIRALVQSAGETSSLCQYRVFIIYPACAMNIQAANALLKTLEEPADKTLLVLISSKHLRMPATILSRCQRVLFPTLTKNKAVTWLMQQKEFAQTEVADVELWLTLMQGSPLRVLTFCDAGHHHLRKDFYTHLIQLLHGLDPVQYAAKLQDIDALLLFDFLHTWLRDVLYLKLTDKFEGILNKDFSQDIQKIIVEVSQDKLLAYISLVETYYKHFLLSQNLNKPLLWEELLIRWTYVSG